MRTQQDSWYVPVSGHAIGPISLEQLRACLDLNEVAPEDKVFSTKAGAWISVREIAPLKSVRKSRPDFRLPVPPFAKKPKKSPPPLPTFLSIPVNFQETKPEVLETKTKPVHQESQQSVVKVEEPQEPTASEAQTLPNLEPVKEFQTTIDPVPEITPEHSAPLEANAQSVTPKDIPQLEPSPTPPSIEKVAPLSEEIFKIDHELTQETRDLLDAWRDWNRTEKIDAVIQHSKKPATESLPKFPRSKPKLSSEIEPSSSIAYPKQEPAFRLEIRLNQTRFLSFFVLICFAAICAVLVWMVQNRETKRFPWQTIKPVSNHRYESETNSPLRQPALPVREE